MWRVFGGAVLVVAGIAALSEAHSHSPAVTRGIEEVGEGSGHSFSRSFSTHSGLSQTAYDVLRIGAWALVIFGAVLLVVGLIGYARREAV